MFDLVTVGHLSIDYVISPRIPRSRETLGGPPTFCSLAAKKLDARVSIVSKVGGDFPPEYVEWLAASAVDLSGMSVIESASTTRFVLRYEEGRRMLRLKSRAPSIRMDDIPDSLRSRAIHAAPIADELPDDTIGKMRGSTDVLSLDPQGLLRIFDEQGNASLGKRGNRELLRKIDIFKSATKELESFVGTANLTSALEEIHEQGVQIVIVTKGSEGSILSHKGKIHEIPACEPVAFVDPTGAGDAFIGAFLAEYIQGREVTWCACVGSASASFVVEDLGPSRFGAKREVHERASKAFESVAALRL
ncbi:MAG: PfkB family carbohydrate kinase [Candidatus Bathyarchaeota archaeon]|nr:PfkB family carbohydrate kinase [Candidatus Bathyarchaeota archaeon]